MPPKNITQNCENPLKILIVEDEKIPQRLLKKGCHDLHEKLEVQNTYDGVSVELRASLNEAQQLIQDEEQAPFDIVFLDRNLIDTDSRQMGENVIDTLIETDKWPKLIVGTSSENEEMLPKIRDKIIKKDIDQTFVDNKLIDSGGIKQINKELLQRMREQFKPLLNTSSALSSKVTLRAESNPEDPQRKSTDDGHPVEESATRAPEIAGPSPKKSTWSQCLAAFFCCRCCDTVEQPESTQQTNPVNQSHKKP